MTDETQGDMIYAPPLPHIWPWLYSWNRPRKEFYNPPNPLTPSPTLSGTESATLNQESGKPESRNSNRVIPCSLGCVPLERAGCDSDL